MKLIKFIGLAILIGLTFLIPTAYSQSTGTVKLLMPPSFQVGDTDPNELKRYSWLALCADSGAWALVNERLTITVDRKFEDTANIKGNCGKPLAYIHHTRLSAGPVQTPNIKFYGDQRNRSLNLTKGRKITLRFEQTTHAISIKPNNETGDLHLVIEIDGHESQLLGDKDSAVGIDSASILWAGDLNSDGALDFIVTTYHDEGKSALACLLLSGLKTGKGLTKVACQRFSG
jgi:hypothetical protein